MGYAIRLKIPMQGPRTFYYTTCSTETYHDVCDQQKLEDTRFAKAIFRLIKYRNVITDMIRIYLKLLLKNHTP